MPLYKVSQAETWTRNYHVEAATQEDALAKYNASTNPDEDFYGEDPEYLADQDDIEVYESEV